ncbi:branched-chain amino acid transport system II carrier protein [Proteus terrae subsp. cibarius]|uniref:Branched-chain amino acid transport system carrier protein n=1 Tax=Proteus terrae subsp. cibarius TaxID=626774 RepID=A0A8I1BME4_9GAMM|nr:branched-chain amino acid transport system II carrier protein [Proteus terrae]MBG2915046.1 branched-chain amino acid transport system II carrier protein [Proteus terrae subsp. cibarius]MBG3090958.1 branched-chain amino acid transport system II carrier protein [Proteus terrae subsp. cibarius]MCO4180906.1 branched-chain amino acid transport system II carrier protein [Proteus terrae]MCO4187518.1 branched-chain amino acid transport system II carrier protein [Proteus terrae]QGW03584.1 branched-c
MLSTKDMLVLGMMVFALFLGAGNIIFPPMAGFQSGNLWFSTSLGFLVTGVLLPFLTLVIVAIRGRGERLSVDLPSWVAVTFWVALYLIVGSTFAMPRVTNTAYEMGFLPLGLIEKNTATHLTFALIFNITSMFFMLKQGTMISAIGKFMTPALLVLLVVVGIAVVAKPISPIGEPTGLYAVNGFFSGFIDGYQTMDVLSAMAFGGIVARALYTKGITEPRQIGFITVKAGMISVLLLAALYLCLFYLGATSHSVSVFADPALNATNGGQIFSRYVDALFGSVGTWLMGGIVLLASMTTLVGVTSAAADYFATFHHRLGYRFWVVVFTLMTTIVSTFGLDTLLRVTIPALLMIYPTSVTLVLLQFIRNKLKAPRFTYRFTIAIIVLMSLFDTLKQLKWLNADLLQLFSYIPLSDYGLGWVLPGAIAFVISLIVSLNLKEENLPVENTAK